MDRLSQISAVVQSIEDVVLSVPLTEENGSVRGTVLVTVAGRSEAFQLLILPPYPQQFHENETIKFISDGLLDFGHVNFDGSICVHTRHATDLRQKLLLDFSALKEWMLKYLVNREQDDHYEHIVVPSQIIDGVSNIMLFTEVDHQFEHGDFGRCTFSLLQHGKVKQQDTSTYMLQSFEVGRKRVQCKWSSFYKTSDQLQGIYLFMAKPPVTNGRFAVDNWQELSDYLPAVFLDYLENTKLRLARQEHSATLVMLGYPITDSQIHWQMITIEKNRFPNYRQRQPGTRLYPWKLRDQPILWGDTKNSSYDHFFGRGALSSKLSGKKILMIGIGAIGSMVATTLCRGGCKDFTLIDYEAKEPGNVCRSEYNFYSGVNNKVDEIIKLLFTISPFVEVRGDSTIADGFKLLLNNPSTRNEMRKFLKKFDLIIDCSADNDMAWLLDQLCVETDIINLSITNHAKELVCVTNPNLYGNLMHIFGLLDFGGETDLYNPTGCWSPTFKAGYNEIAVLVQFAIRQIDLYYSKNTPLRNFYLSTSHETGFSIKLDQF